MRRYFGVFNQQRSLFLFLSYTTLSFILMSLNDPFVLRGIRIVALQFISIADSFESKIERVSGLEEDNKILRKQLLEMSIKNQRLQEEMIENIRLKRLLNFKESSDYKIISAKVIGFGQEQTVQSLIINVGNADGLAKNMPVVTERGIVGKIFTVENNQSSVQILKDRNMLVSVRLQKSREVGVITWTGNIWLDLNYIPKEIKVQPGEVIITSGLSRIYPEGLKIGIVSEVEENEYELFKQIKVKPAVESQRLEEVFVLAISEIPEQMESNIDEN